jgi:glycosyltransferase involved in cell wall biosynthesis
VQIMKKPRILFFIRTLAGGGAERMTAKITSELVNDGYEIMLVTIQSNRQYYSINPKVEWVGLGYNGTNRGFGKISAFIGKHLSLRLIIKRYMPDYIVGMMTPYALMAIISAIGMPARVITAERLFPSSTHTPVLQRTLRKILYRYAYGNIVQTIKIGEWLRVNCRAKNIHTIPNSINFPLANRNPMINPSEMIDPSEKIILGIGRLDYQKGFDLLISAFAQISENNPGWKLIILGEGDFAQTNTLKEQIRFHNLESSVSILGRVGNVADWLQASDVYVLSSRYEGFPNSLLEAMSYGLACISYDCDTGPSDIIRNEYDGLLIPKENEKVLADALQRVMGDEELRNRFSNNAQNVKFRFSEKKVTKLWRMVFHEGGNIGEE